MAKESVNKEVANLKLSRMSINDLIDVNIFNADNAKIEGFSDSVVEDLARQEKAISTHAEKVATATEYGHVKVAERPPHEESESNGVAISAKAYGEHTTTIANGMVHGHAWLSDESGDKDVDAGTAITPKALQSHERTIASKNKLGHIRVGEGLTIDKNGVLSSEGGGGVELKPATPNQLGGVMIGRGLTVDERGTLMLASEIEYEGTGAGSNKLLAGTLEQGFFGEVPSSDFIDAETLSLEVGVTQGTVQFNDTPWLKFALDGKILFRPKKAIRNSISYDHLEEKGLIKGDKTIEINGDTYKVRLMKALADEYDYYEDKPSRAKYSEWNRTMLPIHEQARGKSWERPQFVEDDVPYFGIDYTDADLQFVRGGGEATWCQEYFGVNSSSRMSYGDLGVSGANYYPSSYTSSSCGWAPVLELIKEAK